MKPLPMICLFCGAPFDSWPLNDGSHSMACTPCTIELIGDGFRILGRPIELVDVSPAYL